MEELLRVFGIDRSSSGGSRNNQREYLTSVAPSGGVAVVGASRLLVLVVLVLVLVLVMDMWTVDGSSIINSCMVISSVQRNVMKSNFSKPMHKDITSFCGWMWKVFLSQIFCLMQFTSRPESVVLQPI